MGSRAARPTEDQSSSAGGSVMHVLSTNHTNYSNSQVPSCNSCNSWIRNVPLVKPGQSEFRRELGYQACSPHRNLGFLLPCIANSDQSDPDEPLREIASQPECR